MVENVGLDAFVGDPALIAAEDVNLQGQSLVGWLQLSHQESHVLANVGVRP